jgi:hypothetical protein
MPKKQYKNKGVPLKGSELRLNRTVRLSDSAWSGLEEVAKILNVSRADLVEFWAGMLAQNEEKFKEIAANENLSIEEANNLLWERIPESLQQLRANQPPKGFPMRVKPAEDDNQQQ